MSNQAKAQEAYIYMKAMRQVATAERTEHFFVFDIYQYLGHFELVVKTIDEMAEFYDKHEKEIREFFDRENENPFAD